MTHQAWLNKRKLGVTGTDISAILGVNTHKSEDDLILDKLGMGKPFNGNAATRAGVLLEQHVANAWAKREQTIIINGDFTICPSNPRYIGTTDFLTGKGGVLEIKTGAEKTYAKGLPPIYEAQCRWYMMLTERPFADLVACVVPKDRTEIPSDASLEELYEWVTYRPAREYHLERSLEWEARAQGAANRFLARLDALRATRLGSSPEGPGSIAALTECGFSVGPH